MYIVDKLKYDEINHLLVPEVADHFRTMGLGEIDFNILRKELIEGIQEDNSAVFVLKKDDIIVGGLSASINTYLNGKLHAEQRFVYINKQHRGAYLKLMRAFEKWATGLGAHILSTSVLLRENAKAQSKLLETLKYKPLDIYYTKETR
jgi:hypothetical protein